MIGRPAPSTAAQPRGSPGPPGDRLLDRLQPQPHGIGSKSDCGTARRPGPVHAGHREAAHKIIGDFLRVFCSRSVHTPRASDRALGLRCESILRGRESLWPGLAWASSEREQREQRVERMRERETLAERMREREQAREQQAHRRGRETKPPRTRLPAWRAPLGFV